MGNVFFFLLRLQAREDYFNNVTDSLPVNNTETFNHLSSFFTD